VVDGSEHYLSLSLPAREHPSYTTVVELAKTYGFLLETSNRKWWLRDRHKTLNFLAENEARLRTEFGAQFTANFTSNTRHLRPAEVTCDAVAAPDGFDLTVALRAGHADAGDIRAALAANRGYVESEGVIYLLTAAELQKITAAQRALSGDPAAGVAPSRTVRVRTARLAEAQALVEELAPNFQPPAAWRSRCDALRNLAALPPAPLPATFAVQLRPYQQLGVAWLWYLYQHELGGVLADEMGLGKTLQALGLLNALRAQASATGATAPTAAALVVAPASLLENWRREAARFAPQMRTFVHHGEHRLASAVDFARHDLVITSYGTLTRDRELFERLEFVCVIADEAQHIKNRRSQNAQTLRALRARGRFLLTGTPLENSLDDLRSLFEFLMPGLLDAMPPGLRNDERAWYDERLRARTAAYILRRTKQRVAPELPPKLEQVVWCELTPAQATLYRTVQERTERELLDLVAGGANEANQRFAMLTQLLRLRQICCDPRLVTKAESEERSAESDDGDGSAKLAALRELLDEALDDGHRLLVFSQFTSLLGLLRAELDAQGLGYCYLDGSMSARARQAEVDRFQGSSDIPLFLLSLKAGGTGLNLTGADTVVHFDPWWNPAVEVQATDRAHRIGQTRKVTSYKLVCSGTVEEKVLALQEEKRALLAGVFEASDAAAAHLSLADLRSLLT
jgi:SNF2 family DNA or RNA helicase